MRVCCVPFCKSGYNSTLKRNKALGLSNPHLFLIPKDAGLRKLWESKIRRGDRALKDKDCVCSLHFEEEDIEKTFHTSLPDGGTFCMTRERVMLKQGAIPSIFSCFPPHLIPRKKKKKAQPKPKLSSKQNIEVPVEPPKEVPATIVDVITESQDSDHNNTVITSTSSERGFEFSDVLQFFQELPEGSWMHVASKEHACVAVFLIQNFEDFSFKKKIVISGDKSFKVFVGDIEVNIDKFTSVKCVSDLNSLLSIVSEMKMCASITQNSTNEKQFKCRGFVDSKRSVSCFPCIENNRRENRKASPTKNEKKRAPKVQGDLTQARKNNKVLHEQGNNSLNMNEYLVVLVEKNEK